MLNPLYLENKILGLLASNTLKTKSIAMELARIYSSYAVQAAVTPVILPPKIQALANSIYSGLDSFSLEGLLSGVDRGLLAFWPGTVVTGGSVVTYAGSGIIHGTAKLLKNGISTRNGARVLAKALDGATRTVLYVIPPAGPMPLA